MSFCLHGCCGEWEDWTRKTVNHTCWMTAVTLSDHPKSVLNRWLIEVFCDVFVLLCCPFDISVCIRAFVMGPYYIWQIAKCRRSPVFAFKMQNTFKHSTRCSARHSQTSIGLLYKGHFKGRINDFYQGHLNWEVSSSPNSSVCRSSY